MIRIFKLVVGGALVSFPLQTQLEAIWSQPGSSGAEKLCGVTSLRFVDLGCRKRQRQAFLHWLYDSRKI
jgi:hypothetical protein